MLQNLVCASFIFRQLNLEKVYSLFKGQQLSDVNWSTEEVSYDTVDLYP